METIGRALHRFGTPAHRLEEALSTVVHRLGIEGGFFSTPTAIFVSLRAGDDHATRLYRMEPGEVNLEKLVQLDELLVEVTEERRSLAAATTRARAVVRAPLRYGARATALSFSLVAATAAYFLGGGIAEVLAALGVGLLIGLLGLWVERVPGGGRIFEVVAATLAALVSTAAAALLYGQSGVHLSSFVVALAGLIVLLPGFTLTVAMTELATRHLVSGAARLAGAVLVFVILGFGVALGTRVGQSVFGTVPSLPTLPLAAGGSGWWLDLVMVAAAALALTTLFRAHPREVGWIFLAGLLAVHGGRAGATLLGPEVGAFLGALLVGVGSNLLSRLRGKPAVITQMPGLMLLVPGSVGLRGVAAMLDHDTLSGVQAVFATTLIASALVAGLLLANILLPARRPL